MSFLASFIEECYLSLKKVGSQYWRIKNNLDLI